MNTFIQFPQLREPVDVDEAHVHGLSLNQRSLVFIQELAPESTAYNLGLAYHLHGRLEPEQLRRALRLLGLRHPELCARVVHDSVNCDRDLADALIVEAEVGRGDLEERARILFHRPHRLEDGVFRASLVPVGADECGLVIGVHHAFADGTSLALIDRELSELLRAVKEREVPALPAPGKPYADFVAWQHTMLASEQGRRDLDAWASHLHGSTDTLELPFAQARPASPRYTGRALDFELPIELAKAARGLARRFNVSTYRVLLSAFFALMSRVTGQDDLTIGTFVRGRPSSEYDNTCGHFVNSLPLRIELTGCSFGQLVGRVDTEVARALMLQHTPFLAIADRVAPRRVVERNPLFNVMFGVQRDTADVLTMQRVATQFGGLLGSRLPLGYNEGAMDLLVTCHYEGERIFCSFKYSDGLFPSRAPIEQLAQQYQRMLGAAVAEPQTRVGVLPLLSKEDRDSLVAPISHPRADAFSSVHARMLAFATENPNVPAVDFGDATLTYGELGRRCARVARRLVDVGVGKGDLVALFVARSPEFFVGLFAVLMVGAAYVPLDPSYPPQRLAFMVEDSGVRVMIATREVEPPGSVEQVVYVDDEALDGRQTPLPVIVEPSDRAYVIYTSGSTGRPKGVEVPHGALANLMHAMRREFAVTQGDVMLSVAPYSFDLSVPDLFLPLTSGARVRVALPGQRVDGEALRRCLEEHRVTLFAATPSTWQLLIAAGWQGTPGLRVMCGGEAMSQQLASELTKRSDAVWNLYGPTEATVWTTLWRVERDAQRVVLGQPLDHMRVVVLDRNGELVPRGVVGELCIGGPGLALGYLGRPQLTAERFIADRVTPGASPEDRLYRTGDLARWHLDDTLEYLGRADHQVKVRGYRIELGEIEAALEGSSSVRQAVVIAREDRPGDVRLVAYVRPETPGELDEPLLRRTLAAGLPEYMIPAHFVVLAQFPLNTSGKIDRAALPAPVVSSRGGTAVGEQTDAERRIAAIWAEVLGCESVGVRDNFFDLGGHSLLVAEVVKRLQVQLHRPVSMIAMFRHPTVEALARALGSGPPPAKDRQPQVVEAAQRTRTGEVAIIGWSGRFPGANSVDELWRAVCAGEVLTSKLTQEEQRAEGVSPKLLGHPDYVAAKGVLEHGDCFDAAFFGYSPREAETMDAQQRVFLECAWSAVEAAGYDPTRIEGRVGVFGGAGSHFFSDRSPAHPRGEDPADRYLSIAGNTHDFLTARVSYKLNLRGPSVNVQTACSTSLVAVHMACAALREGECEVALAGGVCVTWPIKSGYVYQPGGTMSSDGVCRPFDAAAEGMLLGNGTAVVVLKPLERALADGDTIHAVIRATAVTNDGDDKIGFTAPSVTGQREAIRGALTRAGLEPEDIGFLETHGTGTRLGDPIEVAAVGEALGPRSTPRYLGATKANVGHLDAAAGVTGLIKAALVVRDGVIPPVVGFRQLNPEVDLEVASLVIPTDQVPWPEGPTHVRRAGVTSLGLGGTNAHAIVEQPPPEELRRHDGRPEVVVVSAKTEAAVHRACTNLANHLRTLPTAHLGDVCFTLQQGRQEMPWRRAVVARSPALAAEALAQPASAAMVRERPPVVFLFPGVGCQYAGMGRELYDAQPVYREVVDTCITAFERAGIGELRELLFADNVDWEVADRRLRSPALHMPAIFTVELAVARLLMSWGLVPDAMCGRSLGEITAACVSGVLALDEAVRLVALRGVLCAEHGEGGMLVVQRAAGEMEQRLKPPVAVAVVTAPNVCVVAGPVQDLETIERELVAEGVRHIRLPVDAALHSPMLEPVVAPINHLAASFAKRVPSIPYYSGVTGDRIAAGDLHEPDFWGRHVRDRVLADACWQSLFRDLPGAALLQVGPGHAMVASARIHPASADIRCALTSMPGARAGGDAHEALLRGVAGLWTNGATPDWGKMRGPGDGRRVPLPTYPFARVPIPRPDRPLAAPVKDESVVVRPPTDIAWEANWRQAPAVDLPEVMAPEVWWLFSDGRELTDALRTWATEAGHTVVQIRPGEAFRECVDGVVTVRPDSADDINALVDALVYIHGFPTRIVHAWGVHSFADGSETDECLVARTGLSLAVLARKLQGLQGLEDVQLLAVARGTLAVFDGEPLRPASATLLGVSQVVSMECPALRCRCLDLPVDGDEQSAAAGIWRELYRRDDEPVVAVRGGRAWIQEYVPVSLMVQPPPPLRDNGVVVITGGLGGLGLTIAAHLARRSRAKLVLFSRTGLPPRSQWETWRKSHADDDRTSTRIAAVEALEAAGAQVLVVVGDVASRSDTQRALETARTHFGTIHAVFHAAGVFSYTPISAVTPENFWEPLRPKLSGTRMLRELTREDPLDWFVLCSSTSGMCGAYGGGAYSAANASLNCLAETPGRSLRSFAWSALKMGMALKWREACLGQTAMTQSSALAAEDVVSLFDKCLAANQPVIWLDPEGGLEQRRKLVRSLDWTALSAEDSRASAGSNESSQVVEDLWREVLGVAAISPGDDFFALGGTSLLAIQLLSRLRERLGVRRAMRDLLEHPTLEAFCGQIGAHTPPAVGDPRIVRFRAGRPGEAPLFLLPPATGSLLYYPALVAELPRELPVIGLRQPGADGSQPLVNTREQLLAAFCDALISAWPRGQVRICGHSMGGIFAYLLAQRLRRQGRDIELVALLDTPGPGEMNLGLTTEARIREYMRETSPDLLATVSEGVARAKEAGPGVSDEYQLFTTYGANIAMMRDFSVSPYPGQGLYLRSRIRDRVNAQRPEAQWIDLFAGGLEVHVVPGNHVTLLTKPHVKHTARVLARALLGVGR